MKKSPGSFLFLLVPAILSALFLLAGCQTPAPALPEGEAIEPIGRIIHVYPRDNIAIVRLHSNTRVNDQSLWMVENPAGILTAMIRATDMRRGRTLGFLIEEGLPNPGDSVFRQLQE